MHIGRQISAARGLLLWNISELAEQLGLANDAIKKIENGSVRPQPGTLQEIIKIFGENGVEFMEDSGVYLRPQTVTVYKGQQGLWDFVDNLYSVLAKRGGTFLQTGPTEETFMQYMGDYYKIHKERMQSLASSRTNIRGYYLLSSENIPDTRLEYFEYRSTTQNLLPDISFCVYGGRLALASFRTDPTPTIVVHNIPSIASAYKKQFMLLWKQAKPV